LRVKNQSHPLSLDELTIHRPGNFLVRLTAARRRMEDFRLPNADVPDGLDPVTD